MEKLKRMLKKLGLEKGLVFVTFGNSINSVIGSLFWLATASVLTANDYGKVNYLLSISTLLSVISLLGLNNAVITFTAKGNERLRIQANSVVMNINLLSAILLFFFLNNLSTSLLVVGLSLYTMFWAEILGRKDYKKYAFIVISQRSLQVVLSLALYTFLGIDGLILGFAISTLVFSYPFFASVKYFKFDLSEIRQKISFISHSYSLTLSNSMSSYLDKIIIGSLFGLTSLGLYQISFQFLVVLSIIPLSMFQFLLPREASAISTRRPVYLGLAVAAISCLLFEFIIPSIIPVLFPNFIVSVLSTKIMILGVMPMTVSSILNSRLLGTERTKPVIVSSAVYVGVLVTLLFILGSIFGLIGLSIAVVASLFVRTMCLLLMTRLHVI
jgi:O-antigen/teichoic acid export membrane protein